MKRVIFTLLLSLTFGILYGQGQYVGYRYDASGNRVERKLIDMTQKSGSAVVEEEEEEYEDMLADVSFSIFPNPTSGQLKVLIKNRPEGEAINVSLYHVNGTLLESRSYGETEEVFDLSSHLQGIYLLVITMKERSSTWKILRR